MNFPKALTTSMRCIFTSASINVLTLRSGSTWTMYSNKALVGLGFPFGFKLSQSSLETPNLRAKCIQVFIPGVSLSNKIAASSKQFILSRRVTIVWLSVKWENTQQSINQSIKQSIHQRASYTINQSMGGGGGGGEGGEGETRSGTEKRCSHDLQSGHPA